jgi:hypothetical protein
MKPRAFSGCGIDGDEDERPHRSTVFQAPVNL